VKILNVSPRVAHPLTSGSRVRIFNLLSRLARHHEIRQFSQARRLDLKRLGFQEEVLHAPNYLERRLTDLAGTMLCEWMESSGFGVPVLSGFPLRLQQPRLLREWADWADLVMVEFPWQYAHCRAIAGGKPVVLATHNVQATKARSAGRLTLMERPLAACTDWLEREAVLGADFLFAVSEEDRQGLERQYGIDTAKIAVAPNGADVELYRPAEDGERQALRARLGLPPGPLVVFPAAQRQTPIVEALKWVRRTAELMPEVRFLITGSYQPTPQIEGNVIFTGFVNGYEDYLRASDALLCPMAVGGGTKLKMMDSAATGLPIVTFQETVRGTEFRHGEQVIVVEHNAAALATSLRRVLGDPAEAARLGAAARKCAVEQYDWNNIADQMSRRLEAVLAAHSVREGAAVR